jgi:hypothetical protein
MQKRPPALVAGGRFFCAGGDASPPYDWLPPEPPEPPELPPLPPEPLVLPPLDRPPRELVPRELFAAPLERLPVPDERAPPVLRPDDAEPVDLDARLDPVFAPAEVEFFAAPPLLEREVEDLVEREPLPLVFAPDERELLERPLDDFADDLPELPDAPPELVDEPPSSLHLPLITRCAASATASAISEPRRVALDIAVFAAFDAASAASSPASRILRRAAGLALIAAAAAARPAAIISRLIATFVILSTVESFDFDVEPEEDVDLLVFAFAIAGLPLSRRKTLQKRNGSEKQPLAPGRKCAEATVSQAS